MSTSDNGNVGFVTAWFRRSHTTHFFFLVWQIQSFSLKRSTSNYDNSDANKKALSSFIRSQQLLDGQSGPSVAKTQLTMSRNSLPTLPTITHLDLKHNNNNVTKKLTHSSTLPVLLPPPQPKKNSIKGSSDFLCCFGQPQSTPKISST